VPLTRGEPSQRRVANTWCLVASKRAREAPANSGASVASSRQLHIGPLPERRPIAARRSWNQPTTRIARERPAAPGSPIHGTTASGA